MFHCQNDLKTQKTCRNKLTLSSGTLMFRLKEKFSGFPNFFDQWKFCIEVCIEVIEVLYSFVLSYIAAH